MIVEEKAPMRYGWSFNGDGGGGVEWRMMMKTKTP